jgi:hypothetical protein
MFVVLQPPTWRALDRWMHGHARLLRQQNTKLARIRNNKRALYNQHSMRAKWASSGLEFNIPPIKSLLLPTRLSFLLLAESPFQIVLAVARLFAFQAQLGRGGRYHLLVVPPSKDEAQLEHEHVQFGAASVVNQRDVLSTSLHQAREIEGPR